MEPIPAGTLLSDAKSGMRKQTTIAYSVPDVYSISQVNAIIAQINMMLHDTDTEIFIEPLCDVPSTFNLSHVALQLLAEIERNRTHEKMIAYCTFLFIRYTMALFKSVSLRKVAVIRAEEFYAKKHIDLRDMISYNTDIPSYKKCIKEFSAGISEKREIDLRSL